MRWHKERDATKTYRVNDCDKIIDDDALSGEEEDDKFLEDDNASPVDDTMRHPSDSFAWKSFDEVYSEFAKEVRNVRLGLACDGSENRETQNSGVMVRNVRLRLACDVVLLEL
ncbi:unnamed protein product [Amaranthus hypochondriacus]